MNKPLFFLSGKPIFKNDVLFWEDGDSNWLTHIVHHIDEDDHVWDCNEGDAYGSGGWLSIDELKLSPGDAINKSGWIFVYKNNRSNLISTSPTIYDSEELAKVDSDKVVADAKVAGYDITILSVNKIEWKENNVT